MSTPEKPLPIKRPSLFSSILLPAPQPSLDDLKLAHILNGETCPPIAFDDFASFVANKEFTSENLLFVIWYRSYQSRWAKLPLESRIKVPIPSTRLADRYQPFAHVEAVKQNQVELSTTPTLSQGSSNTAFSTNCAKNTGSSESFDKGSESTHIVPVTSATYPRQDATAVEDQPMREEAVRAFATFLRQRGSRELGISDELREFAKVCLKKSTAPEVVSLQSVPRLMVVFTHL